MDMTTYEHAMFGATLALALGCHRNRERMLIVVAGAAAALPDWDALSLAFGATSYAKVHRVWGHNLLVASCTGALVGGFGYLCHRSTRARRAAAHFWPQSDASDPIFAFSARCLTKYVIVGLIASLSHLPADLVYSGSPQMNSWPIQLLWPFSAQGWVWPLVAWGDITTTLIFAGEMFALYRWPQRARVIAGLTLLGVHGHIGFCWLVHGA
jgi:membrane-bound metal-dependent hydrolase YbcI (DUF457 family)